MAEFRFICFIKDCVYSVPPRPEKYKNKDGKRLKRKTQLFEFPLDPGRFAEWKEAVGPKLIDRPPGRLCKHHFCDDDFMNAGFGHIRLVLKKSSVPSLEHPYELRTPDPEKPKKVEARNVMKLLKECPPEIEEKKPTPSTFFRKVLGQGGGEDDSDTDEDEIVEKELGFKLDREDGDVEMGDDGYNYDDDDDEAHLAEASPDEMEDDVEASDEEVQMELIKLMAKKEGGVNDISPSPSPPLRDYAPEPSDSSLDCQYPQSRTDAPPEDTTRLLFKSLEQIFRSLQPEVQVVTQQNLLGVMEIAKKMDADLTKNNRLVLKQRVFQCSKKR